MIRGEVRGSGFARRMAESAGRVAAARAESRLRKVRRNAGRWRRAALLWPIFAGDE